MVINDTHIFVLERKRKDLENLWCGMNNTQNFYLSEEWVKLRRSTIVRDNYCCQRCDKQFLTEDLDAHHIIPRADGGADDLTNLLTLCSECHDSIEGEGLQTLAAIQGSYDGREKRHPKFKKPKRNQDPHRKRGRPKAVELGIDSRSKDLIAVLCKHYQLSDAVLTYRDAARELSQQNGFIISATTIWRLAHGEKPKSLKLRRALGLLRPRRPSRTARRKRLWRNSTWRSACVCHGDTYDAWRARNLPALERIVA